MVLNDATVSTGALAGEKLTTTDIGKSKVCFRKGFSSFITDESGSRKGASELSATLPGASIADSNTYSMISYENLSRYNTHLHHSR